MVRQSVLHLRVFEYLAKLLSELSVPMLWADRWTQTNLTLAMISCRPMLVRLRLRLRNAQ